MIKSRPRPVTGLRRREILVSSGCPSDHRAPNSTIGRPIAGMQDKTARAHEGAVQAQAGRAEREPAEHPPKAGRPAGRTAKGISPPQSTRTGRAHAERPVPLDGGGATGSLELRQPAGRRSALTCPEPSAARCVTVFEPGRRAQRDDGRPGTSGDPSGMTCLASRCLPGRPTTGQTTTLTSRPATTITLRGSRPASTSATDSSAAARTASSGVSGATSTRPRTLPFTCTG